jgi:hypothetical protein
MAERNEKPFVGYVASFVGRAAMNGRKRMDFVERLLGWAPDGGDGTFELMLLTAGVVVVVLVVVFRGGLRRAQRHPKR